MDSKGAVIPGISSAMESLHQKGGKTMKCEICKGEFNQGEKPDSRVILEEPGKITKWTVCDVCAAAVYEFILEFKDDIKDGFKNQDDTWKLKNEVFRQRKLEVES